ncbi:MAG: hypothetical protein ACTSRI_22065 [Promethearchaeota archaeon]
MKQKKVESKIEGMSDEVFERVFFIEEEIDKISKIFRKMILDINKEEII